MRTAEDLAQELTQLREHARRLEAQRDAWQARCVELTHALNQQSINTAGLHALIGTRARAGTVIINVQCTCGLEFFNECDWLLHRAANPDHAPAPPR